jgi:hypothetical protein
VLCAGSTLLLGEEAPTSTTHQHFLAPLFGVSRSKQVSPSEVWLSPTGSINLGFTTEGNLLLCSSYLPLGVPNWVLHHTIKHFFWPCCRGERSPLQGESIMLNLLFYFLFALFYFYLHLFIKNTKKFSFFIVACTCLLLVLL